MELDRLRDAAEAATTVASAHRAGLLRALTEAPGTTAAVAARAELDPRATEIVLGALEDLGVVTRGPEGWAPTPDARRALCDPSHPEYRGGGLDHWLENLRSFTGLPDVLRSGGPLERSSRESDEGRLRRFMSAMAAAPADRVRRIVEACLSRAPGARRALDLGGGPGHMSRALAEHGLEVTLVDTPVTVDFVRREFALDEVDGLELVGRDFHEDPLPEGPWDLVLLSNVVHIYGAEANRRLLARVGRVTAPGGVAAVMDFVRGRSPRAARFALVMLLRTEAGNTYTAEEIRSWLREGGFGDVQVEDVDPGRQLVTGLRREPGEASAGSGPPQ